MNMKQFSESVGLSAHTLRYYEKIDLLKNIQRNSSGHRVYTIQDLHWIEFVKRLKETAMPLDDILAYSKLREAGTDTLKSRQAILEKHQATLQQHIAQQQSHLSALEDKISLYKAGKVR